VGSRIVKQPDGRYAHFAASTADFTHMNMSRDEAVALCVRGVGTPGLPSMVDRADSDEYREAWSVALAELELKHGAGRVKMRRSDANGPVMWLP
jgi:hypothetical protein